MFFISSHTLLADQLSIISPHRKSIQEEFIPRFEKYYAAKYNTPMRVEWVDLGGAENDVRFIHDRASKGAIGVDVFWGGGEIAFYELQKAGLLLPLTLPEPLNQQIPSSIGGMNIRNPTWVGTALSVFGIFCNRRLLTLQKLPEPKEWKDLAAPAFYDQVSLADPRHSSSALMANLIIWEALGWEKGWSTLTLMGANAKQFTQSSSDPIKVVVSGEVAASTAVDFYAMAKITLLGEQNLGFILPKGQTLFNSDPVAMLKGTPNQVAAQRFIEYLLSPDAQKLLLLKKGDPQGPSFSTLARISVNPETYKQVGSKSLVLNPFEVAPPAFLFDVDKNSRRKAFLADLIGIMHVDMHKELKKAWKTLIANGHVPTEAEIKNLTALPVIESQVEDLVKQWNNPVVRNKTMNDWVELARKKYAGGAA